MVGGVDKDGYVYALTDEEKSLFSFWDCVYKQLDDEYAKENSNG